MQWQPSSSILGEKMEEGEKESNNEVTVERDERMIKVLYLTKFITHDTQLMSETYTLLCGLQQSILQWTEQCADYTCLVYTWIILF